MKFTFLSADTISNLSFGEQVRALAYCLDYATITKHSNLNLIDTPISLVNSGYSHKTP